MKRMCAALFLSVCLHIAVLSLIPQDAGEAPVREILRVSLLAAGPPRGGGASGGGGAPAPAEDAGQRGEERVQSAPQPMPPVPRPPRQTPPPVQQPPRQTQPPAANARPPDPQQQPRETQPTPREERASRPVSNLSGEENTGSESGETLEGNASGAGLGSGSGSGSSPETGTGDGSAGGTGSSTGIVDAESLKVLRKKTPDYPMISRRRKDQGTVVLLIRIEAGLVQEVEIERSSGHTALDESAARAVREWRFDVTGYGDSLTARISFAFSLK